MDKVILYLIVTRLTILPITRVIASPLDKTSNSTRAQNGLGKQTAICTSNTHWVSTISPPFEVMDCDTALHEGLGQESEDWGSDELEFGKVTSQRKIRTPQKFSSG